MFQFDPQLRILGVTTLENLFITEYMPSAKGDYVKVYLSALYHCQLGDSALDLEELSQELGLSPAEIEAALRYWERRRLLTRISESPLQYKLYHLGERMLTGQDSQGGDQEYVTFSEAVYAVFQDERKVRPSEIANAYEWVTELKLPQEVVLMLLNYCKDTRGKSFTFKAAAKLAVQMREDNILSPEEAENYFRHSRTVHEGARSVLKRFNLRRQPTEDELALYRKWTGEWRFDDRAILAACTETVKASNPSFGYLDGILRGLKQRGAVPGKDVQKQIDQENALLAGARDVLAALGIRLSPTVVAKAYENLLALSSQEMILLAARDVGARRGRFEDIEKVLKDWKQKGITSPAQVPAGTAPQRPGKTVSGQRYQQRDYDEQALSQSMRDMLKEAQQYDP